MPKFKVLTPIEHNMKQFWPETDKAPKEAPSFGSGAAIPVDGSGVVELSEAEAAHLVRGGALSPLKAPAPKKEKAQGN